MVFQEFMITDIFVKSQLPIQLKPQSITRLDGSIFLPPPRVLKAPRMCPLPDCRFFY